MTSTSTVLLATLPAAVTSCLAYAAARQSGRAATHAADLTHELEMTRLREETRRARDERDQALRDNRQGTYHQLLAVAEELRVLADMVNQNLDIRADYAAWRERFAFAAGGALIFGTDEVSLAATQFAEAYRQVSAETDSHHLAHEGTWIECLRRALDDHSEEIATAREKLREAMRDDVGARAGDS